MYSRNSENNTSKYPDIIEMLQEILNLKPSKKASEKSNSEDKNQNEDAGVESNKEVSTKVKTAIIDAEVVAYDTENKVILPFQVLSTRKRKVVKLLNLIHILGFI